MANKKQPAFTAPTMNPYKAQPQQEETTGIYRFNAKFPIVYKDYLQEMAWRNRCTITEYLIRIVQADMDAHPEWRETIDILNR